MPKKRYQEEKYTFLARYILFLGRLISNKLTQHSKRVFSIVVTTCLSSNGRETKYNEQERPFWLTLLGAKIHLKCSFFVIIWPFDLNQVVTELYTSVLHCPDNLFEVKRQRNDEERTYIRCIFAPTPPHQKSYMVYVCRLWVVWPQTSWHSITHKCIATRWQLVWRQTVHKR